MVGQLHDRGPRLIAVATPDPVTVGVADGLMAHVRFLLHAAWRGLAAGATAPPGINGLTPHALPAIISAVAAVEAFVDEAFLGEGALGGAYAGTALAVIPREWIDGMDLSGKLLVVPFLATGASLPRSDHRHRDMSALVTLRTELVRATRQGRPKVVRDLVERGIALPVDGPWPGSVSTVEAVRWAHNTACVTVGAIVALMPEGHRERWQGRLAAFKPVSEDAARRALAGPGR